MNRKKNKLSYRKERVVLSDVLPYELPLTFSNRHFYEFLIENRVEFDDGKISWASDDEALDSIIRILVGVDTTAPIRNEARQLFGRTVSINSLRSPSDKDFPTIPFGYKIRHKEYEFRELAICHPRSQLQMIHFYDRYKELILYYCAISPFSIRKPTWVSRFVFHRDRAHYVTVSGETVGVEEFNREYENLRSFFVYKDYSYVFKFYESPRFHNCEKKYDKLLRLDIFKCFDSIYTHSLAWALLKKGSVKEHRKHSDSTFAGAFDKLMRNMNYGETNGILIGPEFSRIFAELILQSVDRAVLLELCESAPKCLHEKDYEIARYVDDYFVFYNDEKVKDAIVRELQLKLKEYKLYLNSSKATSYAKPIITNISIAKQRIEKLLNQELAYAMTKPQVAKLDAQTSPSKRPQKTGSIRISPKELIIGFKTVIKESGVEYRDTLNYALSVIERRSLDIIRDYHSIAKTADSEKDLCDAILGICEFTFFIYSVSPRANTTIRLCRVLQVFTSFFKSGGANRDLKHSVFKRIFDDISFILDKNRNPEHAPVETLYLLVALAELGKDYWLDLDALASYVGIKTTASGEFDTKSRLNYISLVVLLFYMKDKKRYRRLRDFLELTIRYKFRSKSTTLLKETELTLLLFDTLACPYVKLATKRELLNLYGIVDPSKQAAVIGKRRYWFTKWTNFDFAKELDAKRGQDVY